MSMITMVCMVCGETYTVGVVGSATYGGHECPVKVERDRLHEAVELYRIALDKARDCCGCGEGMYEQCAADILTDNAIDYPERTLVEARKILATPTRRLTRG